MSGTWTKRAEDFLWHPPATMADGPGHLAVVILRYVYAVGRDVASGQLTLRAMSLVYTTLLSVVPLIAFSFSILKAFGFHRQLEPYLYKFFEPLGPKGTELTNQIIAFVDNVKGSVLGSIGLLLLVYTVISMVQKVENSFNWIWQVKQARSLARRFSDYLSVILIGPILMLAAMGMIGSVASNTLVQKITSIEPFGTALVLAGRLVPALIVSFVFAFLYVFITNTKVRIAPALTGAFVAGLTWAITGKIFASVVVGSTKYAAIYSSFAIMIIALIWLYLNWLILLLGSQIAFYCQHPEYLKIGRTRLVLTGSERETLAVDLMMRIGTRFMEGPPPHALYEIANDVGLPEEAVGQVVSCLESSGLIERTESGAVVPGRDLAEIRLSDIFSSIRKPSESVPAMRSSRFATEVVSHAEESVRSGLGEQTLRDLIQSAAPGTTS
jgi:membrane protein